MKEIFEKMEIIGWNKDYANKEMLDFDYDNVEDFYLEFVENENNKDIQLYMKDNDIIASIGFLLDFIQAAKEEL